MLKLLLFLVSLFDGCIIGALGNVIIERIFGDNPLGRILKVPGGIMSGGAYSLFCLWALLVSEMEIVTVLIILFSPLLLLLVIYALAKK